MPKDFTHKYSDRLHFIVLKDFTILLFLLFFVKSSIAQEEHDCKSVYDTIFAVNFNVDGRTIAKPLVKERKSCIITHPYKAPKKKNITLFFIDPPFFRNELNKVSSVSISIDNYKIDRFCIDYLCSNCPDEVACSQNDVFTKRQIEILNSEKVGKIIITELNVINQTTGQYLQYKFWLRAK